MKDKIMTGISGELFSPPIPLRDFNRLTYLLVKIRALIQSIESSSGECIEEYHRHLFEMIFDLISEALVIHSSTSSPESEI